MKQLRKYWTNLTKCGQKDLTNRKECDIMSNRIIKVSRVEFELEDGRTFPIIPPLEEDLTAEEFQEHYDRAYKLIGSISSPTGQPEDTETLGQGRQDKDNKDGRRAS